MSARREREVAPGCFRYDMNDYARLLTIMNDLGGTTEDELIDDAMFQQVQGRVWKYDDIIEYFPLLDMAAQQVLRLRQLRCH